jgi:hypothetical protein
VASAVVAGLVASAILVAFGALMWWAAPWIVDRYFALRYGEDA